MPLGIGSGLDAQIGFAPETTWGTPVTTGMRFFEYTEESLGSENNTVQGVGLTGGGLSLRAARRARTTRNASGDVTIECGTVGMPLLWQYAIGAHTAAGVQIGTTGVYDWLFKPGKHRGKSLTVQKTVPNPIDGSTPAFTYTGCKITEWELSCAVDEIAMLKLSLDVQDERSTLSTPTPGLAMATASYPSMPAGLFHFAQGGLVSGSAVSEASGVWSIDSEAEIVNVTSATVKQTNPMKTDRFFFNSAGLKAEQIENDRRGGEGELSAEFSGLTQYEKFRNDTQLAIALRFVGDTVIGSSGANVPLLELLMPACFLTGESPKVGGPDVVEQNQPFTFLQPESTAPDIQIRYRSVDATI